jgi:hypothetical protein
MLLLLTRWVGLGGVDQKIKESCPPALDVLSTGSVTTSMRHMVEQE